MCFNCPDYVDYCQEGEGATRAPGKRYGTMRIFYIGDRYCQHKQAQYGHEIAMPDDGIDE